LSHTDELANSTDLAAQLHNELRDVRIQAEGNELSVTGLNGPEGTFAANKGGEFEEEINIALQYTHEEMFVVSARLSIRLLTSACYPLCRRNQRGESARD
jgi:hypothetical protein